MAGIEEGPMNEQKFPPGWDEARVRELIAHYDAQTEDDPSHVREPAFRRPA